MVVDVRLCLWYFALLGGGGADEGNSAGLRIDRTTDLVVSYDDAWLTMAVSALPAQRAQVKSSQVKSGIALRETWSRR